MKLKLKSEDIEKMRLAKSILENEYKLHYTNQQLAQKLNTNEFKLKHGFKQIFNKTLYEYLTYVRIEKAKDLLEYTEYPVWRVASKVGFPDAGNFSKRFKQCTGVLPLEYRKMKLNYQGDWDDRIRI